MRELRGQIAVLQNRVRKLDGHSPPADEELALSKRKVKTEKGESSSTRSLSKRAKREPVYVVIDN